MSGEMAPYGVTIYGLISGAEAAAQGIVKTGDLRLHLPGQCVDQWDGTEWVPVTSVVPAPNPEPEVVGCSRCGKGVSNAVTVNSGDPLIVRAWVECPECVEAQPPTLDEQAAAILRRFFATEYVGFNTWGGFTIDGTISNITDEERATLTRLIEETHS